MNPLRITELSSDVPFTPMVINHLTVARRGKAKTCEGCGDEISVGEQYVDLWDISYGKWCLACVKFEEVEPEA